MKTKRKTDKEVSDEIKRLEKQVALLMQPTDSIVLFFSRIALLSATSMQISKLKWVLGEEDEQKKG